MGLYLHTNGDQNLDERLYKGALKTLILLVTLSSGCTCASNDSIDQAFTKALINHSLDKSLLKKDLEEFTKKEHPFGSQRQKELAEWIDKRIKVLGLKTKIDNFESNTPNLYLFLKGFI